MQLPPGGQFCSQTQVWGRGTLCGTGWERDPFTHRAGGTHGVGGAHLRGTPAEGVRAVGVGLPTPPPQQQRRLPGSIGRLRFPDSGRGGCTRPRLPGLPSAPPEGAFALPHFRPGLTTFSSSLAQPRPKKKKKKIPSRSRFSSEFRPFFVGYAFLLLRRSGPY